MDKNVSLRQQVRLYEQTGLASLEPLRSARPYKIPKGYMEWRYISGAIATGLYMLQERVFPDIVGSRFALLSSLWYKNNSPIYCLERGLFRELKQTEITSHKYLLKELDPSITQFILVLPENAVITPAIDALSFVIVDSINIKNYVGVKDIEVLPPESQRWIEGIEKQYEYQMCWSAIDDGGSVWYSGRGVDREGNLVSSNEQIGRDALNDRDREFIGVVENLIFNVLLLLTYEPETVTEYREASKGFKPKTEAKEGKEKFWYPRWIAEPPEMKVQYVYQKKDKDSPGGHRASPHPHMRKAHWKRVRCGERGMDRKWVRIKSSQVLGEKR